MIFEIGDRYHEKNNPDHHFEIVGLVRAKYATVLDEASPRLWDERYPGWRDDCLIMIEMTAGGETHANWVPAALAARLLGGK